MSGITTHILDTARGRPAAGVTVILEAQKGEAFAEIARGKTDDDGRCRSLLDGGHIPGSGVYRLHFETGPYFEARGESCFHPFVTLAFSVDDPGEHYHVPLLLSPFGYTTYRGS